MKIIVLLAVCLAALIGFRLYKALYMRWLEGVHTRDPVMLNHVNFDRDARLVENAVRQNLIDRKEKKWSKFNLGDLPPDAVGQIKIADIFYDVSGLRMAALVATQERIPDLRNRPNTFEHFSGDAVIGFRERLGEPYKLWYLRIILISSDAGLEKTVKQIRVAYLHFLRKSSVRVGSEWDKLASSGSLGVNIDDPEFWDSVYWNKESRRKGYYPFQVTLRTNMRDAEPWIPIVPLVDEYPEEILSLYRAELSGK